MTCKQCGLEKQRSTRGFPTSYREAKPRGRQNAAVVTRAYRGVIRDAERLLAAYKKNHIWPDTQRLLLRDIKQLKLQIKRLDDRY